MAKNHMVQYLYFGLLKFNEICIEEWSACGTGRVQIASDLCQASDCLEAFNSFNCLFNKVVSRLLNLSWATSLIILSVHIG